MPRVCSGPCLPYSSFALFSSPCRSCKDIVTRLLDKRESTRLGSKSGASEVKQHKWFAKINWGLLRNTQPPVSSGSRFYTRSSWLVAQVHMITIIVHLCSRIVTLSPVFPLCGRLVSGVWAPCAIRYSGSAVRAPPLRGDEEPCALQSAAVWSLDTCVRSEARCLKIPCLLRGCDLHAGWV